MLNKKPIVAFTAFRPDHQQQFWNSSAQETADRMGIEFRMLPARENPPEQNEWIDFFQDADAIISSWNAPRLDDHILQKNHQLRFVGHAGGSVAGVVSPYLYENGIPLSTCNSYMAKTVAQWCLTMGLIGLSQLPEYAQWGAFAPLRWEKKRAAKSVRQAVVGIWGYGDISRGLIEYLAPLNPKEILICSRSMSEDTAREQGLTKVSLEELFAQSDLLYTLQALSASTHGIITKSYLDRIPDNAVLVNAGRAHLIDEADFLTSLQEHRYTAITDVHYEEPRSEHSPFAQLPNLIATPHSAAMEREPPFVRLMLEEYNRILKEEPLLYQVTDYERASTMTAEVLNRPKTHNK